MTAHGSAERGRATLHWESAGTGVALLLVAGMGMNATGWWRTIPVLARRFRVIAFDNRGAGRSSPLPATYTTGQMAQDAAAVLDAAGVEAAHVYGFSLGGMVAQRIALHSPERVRSLVLGATHAGGFPAQRADPETLAFFRRRVLVPAEESLWASVPYGYGARARIEQGDRIAQDLAQRLRFPATAHTYRAQVAAAMRHDCSQQLTEITAPTLVVHGGRDRMVPLANGELLAERIPGSRLHVIPDAGHFYATEQPSVDELISAFLAETH